MRTYITIVLLFLSSSIYAIQGYSFKSKSEDTLTYTFKKNIIEGNGYQEVTYTFEGFNIEKIKENGETYDRIYLNGLSNTIDKGEPELPFVVTEFFVKSRKFDFEILSSEWTDIEGYSIVPARGSQAQLDEEIEPLTFSKTYTTNNLYPAIDVRLDSTYEYMGELTAYVYLYPVRVNPVTKQVHCCKSITFRINETKSLADSDIDADEIQFITSTKKGLDFIIVTTPKYESVISDFVDWKTQQGYRCVVISKDFKDSLEVKNEIQSVYFSFRDTKETIEHAEHLMIVGDYKDVPGYRLLMSKDYSQYYGLAVTDHYFVALNDVDTLSPLMTRGRIPVSTAIDAYNALKKIINYERNPTTNKDFYQNALHCAQFQREEKTPSRMKSGRHFIYTSEVIRNYMMGWGKNVNRVYYAEGATKPLYYQDGTNLPESLTKTTFNWNGNNEDIIKQINKGCYYVFHRDHGDVIGWAHPQFITDDIDQLKNKDLYPVVFSINCLTGSYQAKTISERYKDKVCLAESFLVKPNAGAVGVFAPTAVSDTYENEFFIASLFNLMYPTPGFKSIDGNERSRTEPVYEMGHLLNKGLTKLRRNFYSSEGTQYTTKIFHYYGDPSMQIYTEVPTCFDPVISEKDNVVTIDAGVDNCNIALSSTLDHGKTFVNVAKGARVAQFSNIDFPYTIVITKHNFKPYIGGPGTDTLLIQNTQYTTDNAYQSKIIKLGSIVDNNRTSGDVTVSKNARLTLKSSEKITFKKGFKVKEGKVLASIEEMAKCQFSYNETISIYNAVDTEQDILSDGGNGDVDNILTNNESNLSQECNSIYVKEGQIVIELQTPMDVVILNTIGQVLYKENNLSNRTIYLKQGIYVVKYGDMAKKLIVTNH